jgi:hypothetical protein
MPRRAELNEHRNHHQMATVRRLKEKASIGVVYDAAELDKAIQWVGTSNIRPVPHRSFERTAHNNLRFYQSIILSLPSLTQTAPVLLILLTPTSTSANILPLCPELGELRLTENDMWAYMK